LFGRQRRDLRLDVGACHVVRLDGLARCASEAARGSLVTRISPANASRCSSSAAAVAALSAAISSAAEAHLALWFASHFASSTTCTATACAVSEDLRVRCCARRLRSAQLPPRPRPLRFARTRAPRAAPALQRCALSLRSPPRRAVQRSPRQLLLPSRTPSVAATSCRAWTKPLALTLSALRRRCLSPSSAMAPSASSFPAARRADAQRELDESRPRSLHLCLRRLRHGELRLERARECSRHRAVRLNGTRPLPREGSARV
jgi:hypothetical protein